MYFKFFVILISVYGLFSFVFLGVNQLVSSTETSTTHAETISTNASLWRRFKRQVLPVEHLKIHSIQSNITINGENIEAISSESIIGLQKEPYNATVFSRHSDAHFDSNGTFVRINAQSIDFALLFQRMVFRSMANGGDLEMRVNNQATNQSMLRLRLAENVQFGLTDEQSLLRILSSNATQISLTAATDQQKLPRQLQLGYDNQTDVFKIQFTEDQSRISVDISKSILHINYGNIFLQMDNNYRRLIVLTSGHRLEFHTLGSQFQLQFDQQGMSIIYPHDNVRVHASNNSRNVSVDVDTLSKMNIRHTEDSRFSLKGSNFTNASINNLEVISARMNLHLYADNDSLIMATTNQSRLTLNSSSADFLLASTIHQIEIIGSKPFLLATTENVAIVVTSINGKQIQIPNITVPDIDYNRYNLQNLTQLDSFALNSTWLTSKVNVADLIGEDITPIRNFSSIIGSDQYNNTSGPITIPPIIINTNSGTTRSNVLPTLFPEFSTLAPFNMTQSPGQQTQATIVPNTIPNQQVPQTTLPSVPIVNPDFTAQPPIVNPDFTAQPPIVNPTGQPPIVNPDFTAQPPIVNPDFTAQPPIVNPDFTAQPPIVNPDFTAQPPLVNPTGQPPIVNPDLTAQPPIVNPTGQPQVGPDVTNMPITNPDLTAQPPIVNPEMTTLQPQGEQTTQTINPLITNLPPDYPTPSTIEQAIGETGFPIPPFNVGSMNDGTQTILTTAQTPQNGDDNFVFGQFETQPPNTFPLEATIVNVSLSVTTPIPMPI